MAKAKVEHYTPPTFGHARGWIEVARRSGSLDKFHGYPKQDPTNKPKAEVEAYEAAYANATRAGE